MDLVVDGCVCVARRCGGLLALALGAAILLLRREQQQASSTPQQEQRQRPAKPKAAARGRSVSRSASRTVDEASNLLPG